MMILLEFGKAYPGERQQQEAISKILEGFGFGAAQPFARDRAILKWWEDRSPHDAVFNGLLTRHPKPKE